MRVIIWGCGEIGKRIYRPLIDEHHAQIIAYTDSSNYRGGVYTTRQLLSQMKLSN